LKLPIDLEKMESLFLSFRLLIGGIGGAMEPFKRGDRVAILPSESAPASDVLEIASIFFAGAIYVQLRDGRMYSTIGGKSLAARKTTCIVPATAEHLLALRKRQTASATHGLGLATQNTMAASQ